MHCPYKLIVWNNAGERTEYPARDLVGVLAMAKGQRTLLNRTVKVSHAGDSIRHWSRTISARRNHWATHSTAECSRSV